MRSLLLVLLGLPLAVAATIPAAKDVAIEGRELRTAWETVFKPGGDADRQVLRLTLRAGARANELLASRLLYRGDAWVATERRPSAELWAERDEAIKEAILREWRYREADAVQLDAYRVLLSQPIPSALVRSALMNCYRGDAQLARELARRLVDPRADDAFAGAQQASVRGAALDFLAERFGLVERETRIGMAYALLVATGGERLRAVRLVDSSFDDLLVTDALIRMLAEQDQAKQSGDDRLAFALLLGRCSPRVITPELADRLAALTVHASRAVTAALAGALRERAISMSDEMMQLLCQRVQQTTDLALRHALLLLLSRVAPERARECAGLGSPWSMLANHRVRMAAWSPQ